MKNAIKSDLEVLLDNSTTNIDSSHKQRVFELLEDIKSFQSEEKKPGTIIVLGYTPIHDEYVMKRLNPDIFSPEPISIYDKKACSMLNLTTKGTNNDKKNDDGAVLVTPEGTITNNGIYLEVMPYRLLKELRMPMDREAFEMYGFAEYVGTRHISAIAASHRMPETTIYTLSESTGRIRAYEAGHIICSPLAKEIYISPKRKSSIRLPRIAAVA